MRLPGATMLVVMGALLCVLPVATPAAPSSTRVDPATYAGLHWRNIGPFRGGRTVAVAGISGDGRTFYTGAVGGGVWKTTNAGRTWMPVMDAMPVASIGALAVAPSDPATVYAGSGEADMRSDIIHGNGMYRSSDAGASWTRIGLEDSRQIGRILVDPSNAQTLLVAALGHAYGPNDMRGVYRSTDGGATWTRTLFRDRDTGAIDLASDPAMQVVFASLWQTRRPPWSVYAPSNGPGSSLWKSSDGGVTWSELRGNGIPSVGLGKIGLAVAPSNPARVYAIVDARDGGLYRSDDGGASWKRIAADKRLWQRGWYFCHVTVDPKNADVLYVSDTSLYRSTDGGATFTAIKGSPDGDDFHQLWIDPADSAHMVLGCDQGTSVSIDGGRTWSSWFNQPTGQFYHVVTDNAFPYHLYGAQQDSGAARIVFRSPHAGIDERDWRPVTVGGESGSLAPDPRDARIVFGRDGSSVEREDLRTSQTRTVPIALGRPGAWRNEWTMPLAFGADGTLYASYQNIWISRDRGGHWVPVSGDLTRRHTGVPATLDPTTGRDPDGGEPRGVVYALAPSPVRAGTVWAGTDDGLVYVTRDGGRRWMNVTPPGTVPWSHIDTIEASPFDPESAYVAVDRHRLDDDRPLIAITHDSGRTWRQAVRGLPEANVNVVRADAAVRGLLYAGTETGMFVSFDDGASWQSLQLNLPVTSVRDIAVHAGDLAIATHGRAFWILDDVAPLRELARNPSATTRLFAPRDAVRLAPANDEAEVPPPETPRGENPPDGAPIDYYVDAGTRGVLTLDILDARGALVRRWRSTDRPQAPAASAVDYPAFWLVTPAVPSTASGMHRFWWDFRIAQTSQAPVVAPAQYTVRLTLAGRSYSRPLVVLRDPRVRASDADLGAQYALASAAYALRQRLHAAFVAATRLRAAPGVNRTAIDALAGFPEDEAGGPAAVQQRTFTTLRDVGDEVDALLAAVESADVAPTPDERSAWQSLRPRAERVLRAWNAFARRAAAAKASAR